MTEMKVLLRKQEDGRYAEIGLVADARGKQLTLRMPDGTTVAHERRADEMIPDVFSFHHLLRTRPEAIEQALASNPDLVFHQLLVEARKPVAGSALKAKLADLPAGIVEEAWTTARARFADDPDVAVGEGKVPKYRLVGDTSSRFRSLFPSDLFAEADPVDEEDASTTAPPVVRREERALGAPDQAAPGPPDGARARTPRAPAGAGDDSGVAAARSLPDSLREVASVVGAETVGALARHPLAVSSRLSAMSTRTFAKLVDVLPADEARLIGVLTGRPPSPDVRESLEAASDRALLSELVETGIEELNRFPGRKGTTPSALHGLAERLIGAGGAAPGLLVRLATTFARAGGDGHPALLSTLGLIATQVRGLEDARALESWDLPALASAAARVPFSRTGGRSSLVAAIHVVAAPEARAARWWQDVTLDQVVEGGHGPLGTVLQDAEVAATVVEPLVATHLAQVASRRVLASVWTWPPPVASHVSGAAMRALVERVGARDPLVARWNQDLSNARRIAELEDLVETAGVKAEQATTAAATAERRATELSTRLESVGADLAAARAADVEDRTSRDRQLRVDLLRTLALVSAEVRQSSAASSDEALLRTVDHLCKREDLEQLGSFGDRTAYDPAVHDALGRAVEPGAPVFVVRGGYTWFDGDHRVALVRPQVSISKE